MNVSEKTKIIIVEVTTTANDGHAELGSASPGEYLLSTTGDAEMLAFISIK